MKSIVFDAQQSFYDIAILIKDSHFNLDSVKKHYVDYFTNNGIKANKVIGFNLPYDKKKVSNQCIKDYLNKLLPVLQKLGIKYIYCADAEYFKVLTKQVKADNLLGYSLECAIPTYKHILVTLGVNYGVMLYNPNNATKLDLSLTTLVKMCKNQYSELGKGIITTAIYPKSYQEISLFLDNLHTHPSLTCDIETFGLNLFKAGIGSVAFAWNKNEGGAFSVDYLDTHRVTQTVNPVYFGVQKDNPIIKKMLKQFFIKYKGKIIFHNATYDIKVQILNLFMEHPTDYKGMLYGLEIMTRHFDDTKVIAFLALNTTADISLSLKDLAHEYAGNYAQADIKDIRLIPYKTLLEYNLIDCLSTWYVYDKYYPQMLKDNQKEIYETIMKPSLKILIQMELVGMPIDLKRVNKVESELLSLQSKYLNQLNNAQSVKDSLKAIKYKTLVGINAKLKTKQHGLDKVADLTFNPNSGQHLIELLYNVMGLPVIDLTATKQPATGSDTLEKLINHTSNQEYKDILFALIGLSKVDKILTAFIPNFKEATVKSDTAWLHANFNLNGTMSGRLSCTKPNLQQIPSGSEFGKLIKSCFVTPKGWVFAGADFNALESKINTLLTKDPNKLVVFTEGIDSHSFNAFGFWADKMPNITKPQELEKCYEVRTSTGIYYLKESDKIMYQNNELTCKQFIALAETF